MFCLNFKMKDHLQNLKYSIIDSVQVL